MRHPCVHCAYERCLNIAKLHRLCVKQKKTERALSFANANAMYFILFIVFVDDLRHPGNNETGYLRAHTHALRRSHNEWQHWRWRRHGRTRTIFVAVEWAALCMRVPPRAQIFKYKTATLHTQRIDIDCWAASAERSLSRRSFTWTVHRVTMKYACVQKWNYLKRTGGETSEGIMDKNCIYNWCADDKRVYCLPLATVQTTRRLMRRNLPSFSTLVFVQYILACNCESI